MALTVDAESSCTFPQANVSSVTWSHTIGSGSNRLLVILVSWFSDAGAETVSSITFNGGTAATSVGSWGGGAWVTAGQMFYIKEADLPSAGTYSIVVTMSASTPNVDCGAMSYAGAAQTSSMDGFNHSSGAAAAAPTVSITSATGRQVIASYAFDTSSVRYVLATSPATIRWVTGRGDGASTGGQCQIGATQDGAATTAVEWTVWTDAGHAIPGAINYDAMGASINAASGGGGGAGVMWLYS